MNKPFQFISHLFNSVFQRIFHNLNGLITEREQSVLFLGTNIIFLLFFLVRVSLNFELAVDV